MKSILIEKVLPLVFAGREKTASELWEREVRLERGLRYLIAAESGTGKTSLCSYIYGFRTDYTGSIKFDNVDIHKYGVNEWCEIRKREIAYLPQDMRLFDELTAFENVMLKNQLTNYKSESDIKGYFEQLGIADKLDALVGRMSIGQRQRVAIIRTLCQPCSFMLLDEPVSHLDERNNALVSELLVSEAQKQGAGIISTSVGNHIKITVAKELKL